MKSDMKNHKVNFLIIGAQKAGTTSLFNYLKQHPDIYFSEVKEVTYFVFDHLYNKGEKYYHSFFPNYKNQKAIGSAYVHMLPCAKCPQRVFAYNPAMKFVVILRNPIDRAYSSYYYALKNSWEKPEISFSDAFQIEKERITAENYDLTYFYNGLYHQHLSNWIKYFPRENFLILTQQELKSGTDKTMTKIFNFLGVENMLVDTNKKYNVASDVHSKSLQKLMLDKENKLVRMLGNIIPQKTKVFIRSKVFPLVYRANVKENEEPVKPLDEKTRKTLSAYFENDLALLKKDFGITYLL